MKRRMVVRCTHCKRTLREDEVSVEGLSLLCPVCGRTCEFQE